MTEKRPIRDNIEAQIDRIPNGPMGKVGDGDLAGLAGYLAVESGELLTLPVPGLRRPGFSFISHGVEQLGDKERHSIRVNAASKDVAEFAAKYHSASSNIDFIKADIEIYDRQLITERSTFNTWDIVVDVSNRPEQL